MKMADKFLAIAAALKNAPAAQLAKHMPAVRVAFHATLKALDESDMSRVINQDARTAVVAEMRSLEAKVG